jgi:hypothetical protein
LLFARSRPVRCDRAFLSAPIAAALAFSPATRLRSGANFRCPEGGGLLLESQIRPLTRGPLPPKSWPSVDDDNAQLPDIRRRFGERAVRPIAADPVCYPVRKECALSAHERSFRRTGRPRRGDLRLRPNRAAAPRKSGRFIVEDTLKQRDEMRIMPALVGRERFRPASATRRPDR